VSGIFDQALADLLAAAQLARESRELLTKTGHWLAEGLTAGAVVFLCGNGGSAAEAAHLAGELVGRFQLERPGLPALALTADSAILTAVGNDYGFEEVFARQIQALGRPGDFLWAMSTSGRSPNVLKALAVARRQGLKTLFMSGPNAPDPEVADVVIAAPGPGTPRIQELHLFYGHVLCQMVESLIFGEPAAR
jgi:D-sedoheptulose 7-phosphate isomerase